jgi:cleavage and polyadenylation specificity factor subunit 2
MDLIQNWNYFLNYQIITPNDVNLAFNNIKSLRYLQTEKLEGILAGISITPYSAGHTIGGTIWRILKDSDNIMYIPDINHKKERLLNGSGILHQGIVMENFERPTLLITGASQPLGNTKTSKNIDDELLNSFKSTLSEGGKVIIPVEVGGRMLEMACTLEELWQEHRLDYPIYILSHHSLKLIQYAQSMLEWLNSRLSELFSNNRENPLNFKHVKPINGWEDWCTLMKVQKNNPMVVLCSGETIQDGEMSFHLMKDWGFDEKNLLLLTNREALSQDHDDALISQVFTELKKTYLSQEGNEGEYSWIMGPLQVNVDANIKFTEPELLEGNELEEYVNKERELRSQRLQKDAMIAHNKRILDGTMDDEDDDDDEDEQPVNVTVDADGNTIKRLHHGTNQPQMDRGSLLNYQYDLMVADDVFNSASNPLNPTIIMYPSGTSNFESRKRKFDDYGEVISILQYSNELSLKLNGEGNQNEDGENEDDDAINPDNAQDLEVKKVERPPCKFLQKVEKVSVVCKVMFIEFQGRADSRSLRNILEGLKPKKMVI